MDADMFEWNANGPMTFSSGREIAFTKTPANVPASYTQTQEDNTQVAKGTKRKTAAAAANTTTTTPAKKTRTASSSKKPPPAAKRTRKSASRKSASSRVIPRSLEECCEADRTLIAMRDANEDWKAIRAKWEELVGEKTAVSTLPNRYARLKSNLTMLRAEDYSKLLTAKREVEDSFENQKWDLVARVVEENGGNKYDAVVLQRQYKKLMLGGGVQPPPGITDADFEIDGEDDGSEADAGDDADAEMEGDDE